MGENGELEILYFMKKNMRVFSKLKGLLKV